MRRRSVRESGGEFVASGSVEEQGAGFWGKDGRKAPRSGGAPGKSRHVWLQTFRSIGCLGLVCPWDPGNLWAALDCLAEKEPGVNFQFPREYPKQKQIAKGRSDVHELPLQAKTGCATSRKRWDRSHGF